MKKMRMMGSLSKRESHVLKLVHPGGFTELHTKPVMASEVMSKNPRHCVTRPDIFRFPWIVVSPESILRPGNVFFIVPCHTIRCLLKNPINSTTTTTTNHTSLKLHHRHESHVDQGCYRARKNNKISNSKKKIQCFRDQSSSVSSTPSTMSCMKLRTAPPREAQKQKAKKKNAGNKAQSFVGSERPFYYYSSEYYSSRDHAARERAISNSRGSSLCRCDQKGPNNLKPCLKKDNTMSHSARSRNLKVRFAGTDDKDLITPLSQLKKLAARNS